MASQNYMFYKGIFLNPLDDTRCEFLSEGLMVVKKGKIKNLLPYAKGLKKYAPIMTRSNTKDFGHSLIMPGFFDMHFHWVQDDVREMPKDSLLEWLQKYTFPTEMKYGQKKYAEDKAKSFFKKLTAAGTLAGACYSSIHENAIHSAMAHVKGDFVIGNVLMNMNSPKELTQTNEESLALTKKLIRKYGTRYCFTPRFAITTTPVVMSKGSKMADKAKCFKQTHLSETPAEIDFVLSIYKKIPGFKKVKSYTEIYERTGMLGKRSLMGHGIHLSQNELRILHKTKTSVIHCPTSNASIKEKGLGSGLFNFKKTENAKVSWALGSDIGGGPFLSMFDVMRSFVEQNKNKKIRGATFVKALYRSTLAGAEIMGLDKRCGNFKRSKYANFIVVPLKKNIKPKNAEEALQKLILSNRMIRKNYGSMVSHTCHKGDFIFKRSRPK